MPYQRDRFGLSYLGLAAALIVATMACTTKDNPDEIRQRTADATANMRRDAKAVAEGVKEGLNRDKDKTVDLNNASKEQLLSLSGVSDRQADRIIAARPYRNPHELVTRRVLSDDEYEKIKDRVVASP
jgi:DNA uptake protein ComE-like DNA-binding protein